MRAYLRWNAYTIAGGGDSTRCCCLKASFWRSLRETTFNMISTFSGTGFSSVDLSVWGPFPFVVLMVAGLIGGCTSSTGCSVKVFRYLILIEAIKAQI